MQDHAGTVIGGSQLRSSPQAPSRIISAPRVAESPVSFECKCTEILQLKTADGSQAAAWLVLGEVVAVHIDKACLRDGIYDTGAVEHLVRGGGTSDYFWIGNETRMRMSRPA